MHHRHYITNIVLSIVLSDLIPPSRFYIFLMQHNNEDSLAARALHWSNILPDNVAIFTEDERKMTFRELSVATVKLAAEILSRLNQENRYVAVIVERDFGFITSVLAILQCDAAYVPVGYTFNLLFFCFICMNTC